MKTSYLFLLFFTFFYSCSQEKDFCIQAQEGERKVIETVNERIKFSSAFPFGQILSRAKAYLEIGECEKALPDLDILIEKKPNDSDLLSDKCRALNCLGQFDEGKSFCEKAIAIDSLNLYAHLNLSWYFLQKNKFDECLKEIDFILEANPKDDKLLSMVYNNKGSAEMMLKNHETAFYNYQGAISLNPCNDLPYIGLANIYMIKRDFEKATIGFTRALKLNEKSKEAYWGFGLLKIVSGNQEEGCKYFEKALYLGANYIRPNGKSNKDIYLKYCGSEK